MIEIEQSYEFNSGTAAPLLCGYGRRKHNYVPWDFQCGRPCLFWVVIFSERVLKQSVNTSTAHPLSDSFMKAEKV